MTGSFEAWSREGVIQLANEYQPREGEVCAALEGQGVVICGEPAAVAATIAALGAKPAAEVQAQPAAPTA